MEWAFIFMMVVLKLPLLALLGIVWWAWRSEPGDDHGGGGSEGDGGIGPRHPRPRRPRPSRRGPHRAPRSPAPPRVRVRARPARTRVPARHGQRALR